jgi:predicted glycoside hydrolase/deacetylase ChbG (UPF0249 family)
VIDGREKWLFVNADDFGQSPGVNQGVIEAHERGIVTSASLMVRWPAAAEAAAYSKRHPNLSLGLHFDLGEWAYIDGAWLPLYHVVDLDDVTAVKEEVLRQLATFRHLVGRGPTHMDSHQHVHLRTPVRPILVEIARANCIPLRHCSPEIRYRGDFYGQTAEGLSLPDAISVDRLLRILATLSSGLTELACHPSKNDDLDTMYRLERMQELAVLCDPRIKSAVASAGINLKSFKDVGPWASEAYV